MARAKAEGIPSPKISRDEMRDALLRSGYLLEARVESVLVERDWSAEANLPYPDPLTDKSRESDLMAHRRFAIPGTKNSVVLHLVIECVNNPQPIAFFTKEQRIPFINALAIKRVGSDRGSQDDMTGVWHSQEPPLELQDYHHYCSGRAATQYCNFSQKKRDGGQREWMAQHEDEQHEVFTKLCAVLDYHLGMAETGSTRSQEGPWLDIYYPVLILQGQMVEVIPSQRSVKTVAAEHVQFMRLTVKTRQHLIHQIDVITERHVSKYLDVLEREAAQMVRRLQPSSPDDPHPTVRSS